MEKWLESIKNIMPDFYIEDIEDDELLRKLYDYKQAFLREESERNEIFKIVRGYTGRYVVKIGGAGSGKSYEFADRIIDMMVHGGVKAQGVAHRIICLRKQRKDIHESQFALLRGRALERYPDQKWTINRAKGDESILLGENQIIFSGLDSVEDLKSVYEPTAIWVEEADQITMQDFNELDRRLRGYKKYPKVHLQMFLSFNPTSVTSWLNDRFFKDRTDRTLCMCGEQQFENFTYYKNIDAESLNINELVIDKIPTPRCEKAFKEIERHKYHTVIVHSTYLDNKFINDEYYYQLEEIKKYDENEYNIYALGQWGIIGGGFFDRENVMKQYMFMENLISTYGINTDDLRPRIHAGGNIDDCTLTGIRKGNFRFEYMATDLGLMINDETIRWVGENDGYITIYDDPQKRTPYVLTADTAGEGSDWNAALCTNNVTKSDVASIHVKMDSTLFAEQVYCMGKWFGTLNLCANDALIAIETNFNTSVQDKILDWGYENVYLQEQHKDTITQRETPKFGFRTTPRTRPSALAMLQDAIRKTPNKIKDITLLKEMPTFVKNEKGKPEAINGAHDDMVMAAAINRAVMDCGQQIDYETTIAREPDLSKMPDDYLKDYESAYGNDELQRIIVEDMRKKGYKV